GAEPELRGIVDRAPRRQVLGGVVARERGEVADLLAQRVDHHQFIAGLQFQRMPRARGDAPLLHRGRGIGRRRTHFGLLGWNGQRQSGPTARPLYWRVSAAVPKSARLGLSEPWSAMSRARVAACIFA